MVVVTNYWAPQGSISNSNSIRERVRVNQGR